MNGGRRRVRTILAGDDGMVLSISKENNHFFLELPNMGKMTRMPESEVSFAVHGFDATSIFLRDATGQVERLIFHSLAGDLPAKKIGERRRR
jgi:hypothetical protein